MITEPVFFLTSMSFLKKIHCTDEVELSLTKTKKLLFFFSKILNYAAWKDAKFLFV